MAIRFVDVGSEGAGAAKPAQARRPGAPGAAPDAATLDAATSNAAHATEPPADTPPADSEGDEAPLPGLTHAKPEPKARGRKKPLSNAGADRRAVGQVGEPGASSAPLLDGLLPELQAHAKPTPKPRGRKKAFG